jgi:hypothetical protein
MVTEQMRLDYNRYIKEHKANVAQGFDWLLINLPELFEDYDADFIGQIVAEHDRSKNTVDEFDAYAEKFYGTNKNSAEVEDEFNLAWLHHQNHNPHHWQYWVLLKDSGGVIPMPMPYEYVIEMICDWWSFSWKSMNLYEIFDWYDKNESTMQLHRDTKQAVKDILELLKDKLDELHFEK